MTCRFRPLGIALAVLAFAIGLGVPAAQVAGQSTAAIVSQRQAEYEAARDAHQAALSAYRVFEQAYSRAVEEVARARRAGDEAALAAALPIAQEASTPKADGDRRVRAAAENLAARREALVDALIVRQAELVGQVEATTDVTRRDQLSSLLEDVSNQISELEAESEDSASLLPVVMPNVSISPRDLPDEILAKALIFERTAAFADTALVEVDEQIAELEDRIRIARQRDDFLADRFGDRQVPTGPPRITPTVQVSDSTGAGGRPVTLEDRLEAVRAHREELVEYRDQLLIRAQVFRQAIRRRS